MTTSSLKLSSQFLVGEMLRRAVFKIPDKEGYVCDEKRLTFRQMEERASHLAGWLQSNEIQKDDKVGFLLKNSIEFAEVFYGIALSGGVGVPMNFRLGSGEIEYILNNSDSKILIMDQEFISVIEPIRERLSKIEKIIVVGGKFNEPSLIDYETIYETKAVFTPCEELSDDDPVMIAYTSGTMGRPKGAVLTHKNLCQNSFNLIWEGKSELNSKTLAAIPLFHIGGLGALVTNCLINGTLVIARQFNPLEVLQIIDREKITSIGLVPAMWNFLFQVPYIEDFDLSSVTRCTTGAAICPVELKKQIIKYFPNALLFEQFGQTETTSAAIVLFGEDSLRKTSSV